MSEKRFVCIDDSFSKWIVDTTLKEDKHEGAIYTAYDMCRKLNELCEENEQLKYDNESLKGVFESYCSISEHTQKELREENEQLRQSVEYWQKKYEEGTETFQID